MEIDSNNFYYDINKISIRCLPCDVTIAFACSELKKYILELSNKEADKNNLSNEANKNNLSSCEIYIGSGQDFCVKNGIDNSILKFDGYIIKAEKSKIIIASNYPRGVLFGVYDLLSLNGCKFIKAGGVSERVSKTSELSCPSFKLENPDYEVRGLTNIGTDIVEQWATESVEYVDWCAKNRINTMFLHENIQNNFDGENKKVVDEIVKRGMMLEFGGHGTHEFVSRELFDTEKELFVEKDGVRVNTGNFCVSNSKALKMVVDKSVDYLEKNKNIDVLHLWFEDSVSGSWCDCEKCKKMLPLEQLYFVISSIADKIAEKFPNVKVDLLLYHDTLCNIKQLKSVKPNILAEFAPRERCYAHSIDDASCPLNVEYLQMLRDSVKVFGSKNISIFEYYMDNILFNKNKCVIPTVIAQDLRAYKAEGITQICPLSFGLYSFWAYDLNLYVYAKHIYHTDKDVSQTIKEFCEDFGLGENFVEYIKLLENFSSEYFAFCGYKDNRNDIRCLPICEYFPQHIKKIDKAIDYLTKAKSFLEKNKFNDSAMPYINSEKTILNITLKESSGILKRMRARYDNYKNVGSKSELVSEFKEVQTGLYEIIELIKQVPSDLKGIQGEKLFIEHLCKDQIWTINELMSKEMKMDVNLDRSII